MGLYDELKSDYLKMISEIDDLKESKSSLLNMIREKETTLESMCLKEQELLKQKDTISDTIKVEYDKMNDYNKKEEKLLNEFAHISEQIKSAKKERNEEFVVWWLNEFPEFDDLTLAELQAWLLYAAKRYKPSSTSDGGSSKVKIYDVQDVEELHKEKTGQDEDSLAEKRQRDRISRSKLERDSVKRGSKITYQDRQRIAIESDNNSPMQTMDDVKHVNKFKEPLGNRNVNKEIKEVLSKDKVKHKNDVIKSSIDFEIDM